MMVKCPDEFFGGDEEDRTPGLGIANAALSQLSYIPIIKFRVSSSKFHVPRRNIQILCSLPVFFNSEHWKL